MKHQGRQTVQSQSSNHGQMLILQAGVTKIFLQTFYTVLQLVQSPGAVRLGMEPLELKQNQQCMTG